MDVDTNLHNQWCSDWYYSIFFLSFFTLFALFSAFLHRWSNSPHLAQPKVSLIPFCMAGEVALFQMLQRCYEAPGLWWFKGCVSYIFASLFCKYKGEHLWNKEKCFLFHFKSSFCYWDNQILTFQTFQCHDVIKCPSMKHQTHFTE